uniref:Replication protein A subunit n=1 Tax=Panagrolaimus superbus TaxID=310955 RepID=A0A914Y0Z5_9BILA
MENIQLSENFFQEFAEDAHFAEPQPVLQILQSRKIEAATICLRLRCSDGVFSYIHCGFDKAIAEKAENEIPDDPSKLPVIKVLAYKVLASQDKNTFIITDYDLISIDMPKIGNPKGHTGDADGQSIKIASFAETAEKFFPQLEENGSYYVSGSQNCIKPANKRFNSTGHDYEITLSHDSVIEAAEKQSYEAPKFVLKQTSLDKLSSLSGQYADILAVIDKVEDPVNVKKKDNTETYRRNIQLIDQSATSIALTLWGVQAEGFSGAEGQIIGIKNAFIREYNGTYSVAVNSGCRIELDPESKDTEILHQWYEGERPNAEVKSISTQANAVSNNLVDELRLFSFFSIPNLFVDPQRGIYFNNVGIVSQLRPDNVLYMSCDNKDCSKKVTEGNGLYGCGNGHSLSKFKYRYMVSMEISDMCGTAWVTLFDKAEAFFGKPAQEMGELQIS